MQKRILVLQDLSSFGRAALVPVIAVISAMGCQCVPLPTAVFSTHTAFPDVRRRDLTDWLGEALAQYKALGLTFDCVLSGYLGSADQIERVFEAAELLAPDGMFIVDPVMGDNGKIYAACEPLTERLGELCARADVITPNVTEAAVLLGRDRTDMPADRFEAEHWAEQLRDKYHAKVVLTGLSFSPDRLTTLCCTHEGCASITHERIAGGYPGTGDTFTGVLAGGLAKGDAIEISAARAARFVCRCIEATADAGAPNREGVQFERCLHLLTEGTL
ncbi:MAG: bifunctional hydroxymethylpyrimidine kinase/phosphomethylpyrimidine kinase [Oscillospiraceae bacterium]|nr:bifunctional hydroxymethylpyrimidine kinase/phosphomethylpyrimidine kinase [Oscillospiraceae bacterium]